MTTSTEDQVMEPPPQQTIELPDLAPFSLAVHREPDRYISWAIRNLGVWEPLETRLVCHVLERGDTFVDVGANLGWFAVMAAYCVGRDGAVFAIEPEPRNFDLLRHNLELNHLEQVVALRAAAGASEGAALLHRSADNLGDHRLYASPGVGDPIEVEQIRLDRILESVDRPLDLVKIDCQGAEPAVLEGLGQRLYEDQPMLILEFWPFGLEASGVGTARFFELLGTLEGELFVIDDQRDRLVRTDVADLHARSRAELAPAAGGHQDLFLLPSRYPIGKIRPLLVPSTARLDPNEERAG